MGIAGRRPAPCCCVWALVFRSVSEPRAAHWTHFLHDSPIRSCYRWGMDDHVSIPCALSSAEGLKKLSGILAQPDASRAEIGRRVCGAFGFVDLRGRPQVTSCLCALRRLSVRARLFFLRRAVVAVAGALPAGRRRFPRQRVFRPVRVRSRVLGLSGLRCRSFGWFSTS